jgi:hypothetical protein
MTKPAEGAYVDPDTWHAADRGFVALMGPLAQWLSRRAIDRKHSNVRGSGAASLEPGAEAVCAADGETATTIEPCEGPFNDPTPG